MALFPPQNSSGVAEEGIRGRAKYGGAGAERVDGRDEKKSGVLAKVGECEREGKGPGRRDKAARRNQINNKSTSVGTTNVFTAVALRESKTFQITKRTFVRSFGDRLTPCNPQQYKGDFIL